MNKPRRHFPGPEKVAILKRHLVDKVPVSDLCDELDIYPNLFYRWQKEFFENGHARLRATAASPRPSRTPRSARSSSSKPSCNARTRSWPNSWRSTPS